MMKTQTRSQFARLWLISALCLMPAARSSSNYTLIGWNDLGVHCEDGLDYSIFTILPPFNTIHAQLMTKYMSHLRQETVPY
jgi:hypothetical protein